MMMEEVDCNQMMEEVDCNQMMEEEKIGRGERSGIYIEGERV